MATGRPPPERGASVRDRIYDTLIAAPATPREISTLVGIREKEVAAHLEHVAKSARAKGAKLVVEPATCLACGHAFRERVKFTTPSRCPTCRSERVTPPRFRIVERDA